jgi:GDPmannose 4,6-dehydratase
MVHTLAALLLDKGCEVYATYRRTASVNFWRIEELGIQNHPNLHLIEFDLTDTSNAVRMVSTIQPDEIYNLAAQSFVGGIKGVSKRGQPPFLLELKMNMGVNVNF